MALGFGSLEIARSGLYVNERGLFVTGQNISNVNTPGYSRQQAMIGTSGYHNTYKYQLGLGADIEKIRQIRHSFLDTMARKEMEPLGYWETRQKTYLDVQTILGEPIGDGLQKVMNQFWDSWQELSKDPSSLTVRATVRQRGETLAYYINHIGSQLDKLQSDMNTEFQVRINEINDITKNIAALNQQISQAEAVGDSANDYRDQRNLQIDRLCKLVDCRVSEGADGQVDIIIGGNFIVSRNQAELITAVGNKGGSMFTAAAIHNGTIPLPIEGGILKGLLDSRGDVTGAKGSVDNGSVYDKIDLVFAFNTNDTSDKRDQLAAEIQEIVKGYTNKGIGVRLGFVAFNETGTTSPTQFVSSTLNANGVYEPDISAFLSTTTGINSITFNGSSTVGGKVADALKNAQLAAENADDANGWKNAARQIVVLSDSEVDGAGVKALTNEFMAKNTNTLVIAGDTSKDDLSGLAEATGDRFISSAGLSAEGLQAAISESVRNSVYGDLKNTGSIIPDIRKQLNLLVSAIAREVNALQRSGMTLGNASKNGMDFFVAINNDYPLEMGNIQLNSNLSDLNNIVASANPASGDNTIALKIANLKTQSLLGNVGEVQSIDEFYQALIQGVGQGGAEAEKVGEGQRNLVNSIESQRLSISSVSMDEEMTMMLKYQFAYGASARVLNVLDEMYESIISRLGLVGR